MIKLWEYRNLSPSFLRDWELNNLGEEGWELISHSVINCAGSWDSGTIRHYYTFKRRKIED